ncbi:hypothetical protein KDA_76110 [Dictyobacter alpinus]|uniref:NACHT domain-containing protein n=1 Tax=Dictyobacter alpinus TaxID=2014873 RepID=A0A402BL91_9CHLR|nr:helix-turn-helix domain-containing protein [Dictyobacter alpinus]GCE32127.1 hypothetical protein KDA_76110 [Dictyobacter alpinus]
MDEQPSKPKPNVLLRQVRRKKHLTQIQLAEQLSVSLDTVRSWESGRRRHPYPEQLEKLCTFFQMTTEELGFEATEETEVVFPKDSSALRHARINRRRMIRRVRATWIDGVLKESLHKAALIALGLQELPEALENPWRLTVQETNLPPRPLPPGTSIVEVYDDADGELLILGEPGGGKTTLLLELARTLLRRADQDETELIPVVFNLSTWAVKQLPLAEWLVEELFLKYHVPRQVAQQWLQDDELIILLDGLDEVADASRAACVKAINHYKSLHPIVHIVVCCRLAEYFAVETRVELQQAVAVQPLTVEQIDQYLSSAGKPLESIRKALEEDVDLQEMARLPLMLSILTLTYLGDGKASEGFALTGSREARRQQVLDRYTQRMLGRRAESRYTEQQTTHWLGWLASQMQKQSLTEFYLERMQPDWLGGGPPRHRYNTVLLRFIYAIESIVIISLFAWVRGGKIGNTATFGVGAGLLGQLGAGSGNTIWGWMAPGIGGGVEAGGSTGIVFALIFCLQILLISASGFPTISWKAGWHGFFQGVKSALITGGIISLFCVPIFIILGGGIVHGLVYGIGAGVFGGVLIGLLSGLLAGLRYETVPRSQDLEPKRPFRVRLLDGAIVGSAAGLSFALVDVALHIVLSSVIVYGTIAGFFCFVAFGFAGGSRLIPGLLGAIKPAESVSWEWESVAQHLPETLRKGLISSLFIALCVGAVLALISGAFYGVDYGVRYGLIYGLIIGLIIGIAGVLASLLNSGWSSRLLNEHQLDRPNAGIRRSVRNAAFAGVLFAPIGGLMSAACCALAFGLVGGLQGWPILGAGFGLVFGLLIGIQFFLIHGTIAWVKHYLLRWYLWRAGMIPINYRAFLDYAASRILLRKVGGGYMFAHRILLDYFASLHGEDTERASSPKEH